VEGAAFGADGEEVAAEVGGCEAGDLGAAEGCGDEN
jgi:hypothetical protein